YEQSLERKLEDLHARVHRGAYRALPSRRTYIAKPDGQQRPLAIAALEDKIVQRAVAAVLNAIALLGRGGRVAARGARAAGRADAAHRRAHERGRGRSGRAGPNRRVPTGLQERLR